MKANLDVLGAAPGLMPGVGERMNVEARQQQWLFALERETLAFGAKKGEEQPRAVRVERDDTARADATSTMTASDTAASGAERGPARPPRAQPLASGPMFAAGVFASASVPHARMQALFAPAASAAVAAVAAATAPVASLTTSSGAQGDQGAPAALAARATPLAPSVRGEMQQRSPQQVAAAGGEEAHSAAAQAGGNADPEVYAARHMHLFHGADGVQAWVRDAALSERQALAMVSTMAGELGAIGSKLRSVTVNGYRFHVAAGGDQPATPRDSAIPTSAYIKPNGAH